MTADCELPVIWPHIGSCNSNTCSNHWNGPLITLGAKWQTTWPVTIILRCWEDHSNAKCLPASPVALRDTTCIGETLQLRPWHAAADALVVGLEVWIDKWCQLYWSKLKNHWCTELQYLWNGTGIKLLMPQRDWLCALWDWVDVDIHISCNVQMFKCPCPCPAFNFALSW